jgi:predicted alpha/beta-hydrolase family hydrolase
MPVPAQSLTVSVADTQSVSALLQSPPDADAALVLAHGAGAGMHHAFMAALADGLADRRIATLRYQFPYMERGSRRTDTPAVAQATVRAAVTQAAALLPGLPLFASGKSFGGRMSSQAQAAEPLPGVQGLVFVGFPLHPPGEPSDQRGRHLLDVTIPMLFLQGTRDELADLQRLRPLVERLGTRATLAVIDQADHSFHVLVRSGRTNAQVLTELLDTIRAWIDRFL